MSAVKMLVWLESKEGAFRPASLEALSAAAVAGGSGAELSAVMTGPGARALAAGAGAYGVKRVYVTEDPALERFSQEGYATAVAAAVKASGATHVFLGHTVRGRELVSRLAQRLDCGVASDVISLENDGGRILAERPIYGGKLIAKVEVKGAPALYSVRPKAFARPEAKNGAAAEVVEVPWAAPPSGIRTTWTGFESTSKGKMDVAEADVLVSGGRGMRGPEGFKMLEELADLLNGAVSCSRPVSEQGWRPHGDHVGQTGKTVSPTLYLACGISGAIQHMAGVSSARVIVAINKDPNAPVFERADYGIVGDLFEVVPRLTDEIRKLQKAG
jgi:electron transfer flavoprotein alpha subunit